MHASMHACIHSFILSFIQAGKQVSGTVYSEIMTIETVNKFRVITGRKSPLTRYHRAIQILQCCIANNSHTHTTQITNIKTKRDVSCIHTIRISSLI